MTTLAASLPTAESSSAAENLPDANGPATPNKVPHPASLCTDHRLCDPQVATVGALLVPSQPTRDAQISVAGGKLDGSHQAPETHVTGAAAVELLFCAAFLDDVERLRVATENRLRSLYAEGLNVDVYAQQAHALEQLEHQATLALKHAIRVHPLGPWIKRTVGVGEKQGARLIAAIGDVAYNHAEDRPRRGPAELWAYCGYVPGQKRRKGVKSNWNAQAKMRAFLCAEAAVKAGVRKQEGCDDSNAYDVVHREATTPLGAEYLAARAKWADHDTSDGHKHNHALRVVAKAILRDLYVEAKGASGNDEVAS